MKNHGCIDGKIDSSGYSSPVPVIGLYIASASLLCMLLMLCDIFSGIRARKRWLPCKFFTLNSVTLTLFSVAAKLPVDLTTPMPSPRDQLSKLSGTTFICISMGFLIPSLGVNPESESLTNMVALTIFVITVAVNTIMQMSTGVIVLFLTEHIIILSSSLVLLLMMWQSYWAITNKKKLCSEENKEIFTKGNGSVFQRLKTSYSYGYRENPQLVASLNHLISAAAMMICSLCCATLIQATFRSVIRKRLEFCSGHSDYDWSMPAILMTQIFTVILGNSAVIYRWLTMSKYLKGSFVYPADREVDDVIQANPVLGITSRLNKYGRIVRYTFLTTMEWLEFLIGFLPVITAIFFSSLVDHDNDVASEGWLHRKSKEDLERWVDHCMSKPSKHLSQLLFSPNNPYHQFDTMEVIDSSFPDQKGVNASSLSIVLLVRVAQVSLPESQCRSLVQAFREAKQVLYYTEKRTNPKSLKNDKKLLFAKSVWSGQDFNCLLPETFNTPTNPPQSDLVRGLSTITQLKTLLPPDPVWEELVIIVNFINRKTYSTLEELVMSVEQLFLDMVRVMLAQLPNAIFKSLNDCTEEEYEENVKLALKITCKMGLIAEHVNWSFPPGCNFTSLIYAEASPQVDVIQPGVVQSGETDVIIQMENN